MSHPDSAWYDRMYNNRGRVPDYATYFQRWDAASREARAAAGCELDLPYGNAPGEKLDVFPTDTPHAPVLVFIHGGYWRALGKSDHSFIGAAFAREGACVVIPGYTLCPDNTVPGITRQMAQAVDWTWRHIARFGGDPSRITVAGHSAGGQLAAMMLAWQWTARDAALPVGLVRNALSVSGLHDLDPIMRTSFLQPSLRLTPAQVEEASPARVPAPAQGTLYAVDGADESEEYHRLLQLVRERWGASRVPVCESLPGLNHFSVLDALAQPGERLHGLALELLHQ
ncbi:alpha/beta hydrolase [Ramlibacter sp.]|uniref:alpha/beta hydrolase n=1 Tax=Ramlibacter sp. TaxID=1917967 RepID=UPI0017F4366F|nr:alpha/beta hydrolase [Ramlibacter sp.]MBA2676443.1 alpha/beta hydrolase [Ramlibacter sp.]